MYEAFDQLACKDAYGLIVAWWFSLYVGKLARIGLEAALAAFTLYTLVVTLSFLNGKSWFYHDIPAQIDILFVLIVMANAILFISPIMANTIVVKLEKMMLFKNNANTDPE